MTPLLSSLLLIPFLALGQLAPENVAILVNKNSTPSRQVAEHYAKARGIPESQFLVVDMPVKASIPRDEWDLKIKRQILTQLLEKKLEDKIRCIVTTYDCPLVIEAYAKEDRVEAQRVDFLESERKLREDYLRFVLKGVENYLREDEPPKELPADASIDELRKRMEVAFAEAAQRASKLKTVPEQQGAIRQLEAPIRSAGGIGAQIAFFRSIESNSPQLTPDQKQALQRQVAFLSGQRQGIIQAMDIFAMLPDFANRDDRMLQVAERANGLLGTLSWIDTELKRIKQGESSSAFDSELTLLYWPEYSNTGWIVNSLHHSLETDFSAQNRTVMMVSRLEASSVELTKRIIDDAVEVEKTGLSGKVYLDARGYEDDKKGYYGRYDASLRRLAEILKEHSWLPVVLDNKPEVFAPGSAPDCALYCGWYSLEKYVPAFKWNRGSVGYHMASLEAKTLREPDSEVWCKRMLEEGACATLGPVGEPYLGAFPLPEEFFPRLLTGKQTLVEVYFKTLPFNSWRMILVGDPLYNPFKAKPGLPSGPEDEGEEE